MVVYVVVYGHGNLEFVFSTEEKANEWIAKQWHPEDYHIWTIEVDDTTE